MIRHFLIPGLIAGLSATSALAQDAAPQETPFAGGTIAITENADYEKVVTFNGKEIGRDFVAWFDREANVSGIDVALIALGPGGNACGAYTLIVWPDDKGGVSTASLGNDCQSPMPAVSEDAIVFVPWVGPGETLPVKRWTPEDGFSTAGMLTFAPEPETGWDKLAAEPAIHPVGYFSNAAFFAYAEKTLGPDLPHYALGLSVASEMEEISDGLYATTGCVPHDCGGEDSLLVVDLDADKAWFAQMRDGKIAQWPAAAEWPEAANNALGQLSTP